MQETQRVVAVSAEHPPHIHSSVVVIDLFGSSVNDLPADVTGTSRVVYLLGMRDIKTSRLPVTSSPIAWVRS